MYNLKNDKEAHLILLSESSRHVQVANTYTGIAFEVIQMYNTMAFNYINFIETKSYASVSYVKPVKLSTNQLG